MKKPVCYIVTGDRGAGKTTLCEALQDACKIYTHFNVPFRHSQGSIILEMAGRHGDHQDIAIELAEGQSLRAELRDFLALEHRVIKIHMEISKD